MKPASLLTPFIPWLALLASCSSPPQPPTVDESRKRPANTAMAVELQVCKHDLENTRSRAMELRRVAASATVTQANIARLQHVLDVLAAANDRQANGQDKAQDPTSKALANSVVTVRFAYGSSHVEIPSDIARDWVRQAIGAPLVMLRGRTDGQADVAAESQIAQARAAAVRDYLVAAGVPPSRIRSTYQPIGDHAADNHTARGQALNRRVEIEIYRALPTSSDATATAGI